MNEQIPFAVLDRFLQELGFRKIVVPGSHIGFKHLDPELIFLFRLYKPDDQIDWQNRTHVKKVLLERGLIDPEQWEELLRAKSA